MSLAERVQDAGGSVMEKILSMLPARRMAQMVYYQLIERTHSMQLEVAQQMMVNQTFGGDALPVNKAWRSNLHILATQRAEPDNIRDRLTKDIRENLTAIEEFERLFKEAEDADIQSFAAAMSRQRPAAGGKSSAKTKA
jgi:hypothetical protein